MDPFVSAALLTGGYNLLGNGINYFSARENREFYSEESRYGRLVGLGMNPNLAMAAVAGAPSEPTPAASVIPGSMDASAQLLFDSPMMKSNINLNDSQSEFYKAAALKNEMESFIMPLEFEEKKRVNDEYIASLKSEGKYKESLSSYYDEMTKWIEPKTQAEISALNAQASECLSVVRLNEERIRESVSQQAVNWTQANENVAMTALINEQKLTQEYITQKMSHEERSACYKACMDAMDYTVRQSINGLPIPDNAKEYFVLAAALGDDEARSSALDMVAMQGELDGKAYELQQKNMAGAWSYRILNQLIDLPQTVGSGFGNGLGFYVGSRLAGPSASPLGTIKSLGTNPAPKPSGTSNSWKNLGRFKSKDGKIYTKFRKPDGTFYYEPVD